MSSALKYIALIRKEDETDYWVDVPDLPGCISRGETIDEAMANFQDALELHLQAARKSNEALPSPREKDEVIGAEEDPWHQAYWVEVSNDDRLHMTFSRLSEY